MIRIFCILVFVLSVFPSLAQEKEQVIQTAMEFIAEQQELEELDLTQTYENLRYYLDHPISLNRADFRELTQLGLLSPIQIEDLLRHLAAFGKLITYYELQCLPYWDLNTIQRIRPFVVVDDRFEQLHLTPKEAFRQGQFEWIGRIQGNFDHKKGYATVDDSMFLANNSYYKGNANKYYSRLRFSYRTNVSFGVTAEKDPGEYFGFQNGNKGFDFYSIHGYISGGKYLRSVALGDYQVQIGQGLNLWMGYGGGKSADATNVQRVSNVLKPYTSVDENRFLRGGAVEMGIKNWSILFFVSKKKRDGTIQPADSNWGEYLSSINWSGLHRTHSEIERRKNFEERIIGTYLRYEKRSFSMGVSGIREAFSLPYYKTEKTYNLHDFRGPINQKIGGDYRWTYRNFSLFGESVFGINARSSAHLHGLMIVLDPAVSLSVLYRKYGVGFAESYTSGFSEGSGQKNEEGIYIGVKWQCNRSFSLNGYADIFRFPWLKYLVNAPSDGREYLTQLNYKPNKKFEWYVRFRNQMKMQNSRDSDGTILPLEEVRQRNFRIHLQYVVQENIILRSRLERVDIHRKSNQPEHGVLMYQDILFKPKSLPFDLTVRYALFETDSYDSRIYAYESNVLNVFSIPAYYYEGSRFYILIRYTFWKSWDIWFKYGTSVFANRTSLGSGSEEILGNTKSDFALQLRLKF